MDGLLLVGFQRVEFKSRVNRDVELLRPAIESNARVKTESFMKKHLIWFMCLVAGNASAATWQPPDELMHALSFVESSHGVFRVGDKGQSLGDYQLSEAAWLDVSSWRKSHGKPTYEYERHVWSRSVSRQYAADYLTILYSRLEKRLHRSPTPGELYAAYNMGMTSFAQCRYQLAKVNPTTAKKCQQIDALVSGR
jgi:hypothetical protein